MQTEAPLSPSSPRVGPLDRAVDVKREAGRLYRAARRGEVPAGDASRLASVLALIARMIEATEVEARLTALEGKMAAHNFAKRVARLEARFSRSWCVAEVGVGWRGDAAAALGLTLGDGELLILINRFAEPDAPPRLVDPALRSMSTG